MAGVKKNSREYESEVCRIQAEVAGGRMKPPDVEKALADAKERYLGAPGPEFDNSAEHRLWLREKHVEAAVEQVYRHCFADDLTPAESKLAWAEVLVKLAETVAMERSTVVVAESLGLQKTE